MENKVMMAHVLMKQYDVPRQGVLLVTFLQQQHQPGKAHGRVHMTSLAGTKEAVTRSTHCINAW